MSAVGIYLKLYADCVKRTGRGLSKNPWVLLLVPALSVAFGVGATLLGPLGLVGGIMLSLLRAALVSAYLYFLGETVAESKTGLHELKLAFGRYFWSVVSVGFVVWIASFFINPLVSRHPKGGLIMLGIYFLAFVLLNATPEAIYQSGARTGLQTFGKSLEFIQANWIEWFIPNLLLLAAGYFTWPFFAAALDPLGMVGAIGAAAVGGALLHVLMVFRGHLYRELDGTSHRQRMYRLRTS